MQGCKEDDPSRLERKVTMSGAETAHEFIERILSVAEGRTEKHIDAPLVTRPELLRLVRIARRRGEVLSCFWEDKQMEMQLIKETLDYTGTEEEL